MSASSNVVAAQAALDAAKAAAGVEEHTKLRAELGNVRGEITQLETELPELERAVNRAAGQRAAAQVKVLDTLAAIRSHSDERPLFMDVLPDADPELIKWKAEDKRLQMLLQAQIAKRDALPHPDPLRFECVKLAQRIEQLRHAEHNLGNRLLGRKPGWQGGVEAVS
jgi:hypothetical protein